MNIHNDTKVKQWNWNEVLTLPLDRYDRKMLIEMSSRAGDWVTCAVGNLCESLPRNEINCPRDFILQDQGREFARQIKYLGTCGTEETLKWGLHHARAILEAIEKRAQELLDGTAYENKPLR
jgi:hypothetical protein